MSSIKILFRSMLKNKQYVILNVLGLSLGLAAFFYIFMWIDFESGYDRFHENIDRIYQVNFQTTDDGDRWAGSPSPLAPVLETEVRGVEAAARLRWCPDFAFQYGDKMFYEENGMTADPQLFDIFSFDVLQGDPKEALAHPHNLIVTPSFAARYFGDEDPMDKQLLVEGEGLLTVKAVIAEVPAQSHIQFDYLLSHKFAETYRICGLEWGDPNFRTYVLANPHAPIPQMEEDMTRIGSEHGCPHVKYGSNVFILRPLQNIYLDGEIRNWLGESGDSRALFLAGTIGLFILLLACINYINLSISMLAQRIKTASVKRLLGAKRGHIFRHYLLETMLVILAAFLGAYLLVELAMPLFHSLTAKSITPSWTATHLLFIGGVFLLATLCCGIYPSLLLSNAKVLRLFSNQSGTKKPLRLLVIFQNIIAITLVIGTLVIAKQMHYIQHKDLGFSTDQTAYVFLRGSINQHIDAVKTRLQAHPQVRTVAIKDCPPYSINNNTTGVMWKKDGEIQNTNKQPIGMETTRIDYQYFELMDVPFVAGRNFSREFGTDTENYIINERAAQLMGLANPVGAEFALYGRWGRIVGVIRDTYFKSLHQSVNPQVFHLYTDLQEQSYFSTLFIKLRGDDVNGFLADFREIWQAFNPGIPFEYHFLDQDYQTLYEKDRRTAQLISTFTILAIVIAGLGLFGQSRIMAQARTKEIGIRKVNGADSLQILALLNTEFLKWITIAFVLACPLAWYAMTHWLRNFAYQTELSWWLFATGGLLALTIALLTVSFQAVKAAVANPVEALRYE